MPGAEIAQYGVAVFAVAGIIYIVALTLKQRSNNSLAEVIKNNTKAIESLTVLLQVTMARQEAKIEEVLGWVKRGGVKGV